jgi:hypothetical protein
MVVPVAVSKLFASLALWSSLSHQGVVYSCTQFKCRVRSPKFFWDPGALLYSSVEATEYTQSVNGRFLAYVPS